MQRRTITRAQLTAAIDALDVAIPPDTYYARLLCGDDARYAGARSALAYDIETLADYGAFLAVLQSLVGPDDPDDERRLDAERLDLATSVQTITSGGGYGAPSQVTAWWPGLALDEMTREEQQYAAPAETLTQEPASVST